MKRLRSAAARAIRPSWRGLIWGAVTLALWVHGVTVADLARTAKHWPAELQARLQQGR